MDVLRWDAIKAISQNFAESVSKLIFLSITPEVLLSVGYSNAAHFGFAAQFADTTTGVVKGGFEDYWQDYKARVEAAAARPEIQEKYRKHLWETASKQLEQLLEDEHVGQALRAIRWQSQFWLGQRLNA